MKTRQSVIQEIKNFTIQHQSFFEKYKQDGAWQTPKKNDVEYHQLISELSNKVFSLIFGDDLSKVTFDLQGHLKNVDQKTLKDTTDKKLDLFHGRYSKDKLYNLIEFFVSRGIFNVLDNDEKVMMLGLYDDMWFNPFFDTYDCPDCNQSIYIDYDCINKKFILSESLSACPTFKHTHKFIFKVPSKKLVFLNKGYELLEIKRKDSFEVSINSVLGKIKECKAYAKQGMPSFALRDGGVKVLHSVDKKIVALDIEEIKYMKFDEETEESYPVKGFKIEGDISLGVFSVYMVDYDKYCELCKDKGLDPKQLQPVYVDITSDKVKVQYNVDNRLIEIKY